MPATRSQPARCRSRSTPGSPSAPASTRPPRPASTAIDLLARQRRFRRVLDVGCGSGVLAIAAAKCWPARVLAVDNDPIAVRVARANAELNNVAGRVRVEFAEGYDHPRSAACGPFDLMLANILADPLIELAPALRATSGGRRPRRPVRAARPPGRRGDCRASAPGLALLDQAQQRTLGGTGVRHERPASLGVSVLELEPLAPAASEAQHEAAVDCVLR